MTGHRGTLTWALAGAAAMVLLLVGSALFLTQTQAGVERAGQYVVERLRGSIDGELEVAGVRSRGLLRGVTLDGVRITGPDGRLFLQADSARLTYDVRTLMGGDISFQRLILFRPGIHIERLPGAEQWNYQTLIPDDPEAPPTDRIVLIQDVTIHDGSLTVRTPWEADEQSAPDGPRYLLEQVPGGLVRTVRFTELNGRSPQILWQAPDTDGRVVQVQELSGQAYIWDAPATVRDFRGTVTIRDSVVTFQAPYVRLPDSEFSALGQLVLGQDFRRYDIEAQGDQLAFADFQWLYPSLPAQGGGAMRLRIQSQEGGNIVWLASDARLRTAGSELAGSFGVVTGDTLYFTNVDVRASPLDMELVRRLLPVDLPIEGFLSGAVEMEGPVSALRTRGQLRHRTASGGARSESEVRWSGVVRARQPFAVSDLDADIRRLDLSRVAALVPDLRIRGSASGQIRLAGSVDDGFEATGTLSLDQAGTISTVTGGGWFLAAGESSAFDLHLDAEPISLSLLSQQYSALNRLIGAAEGPVRLEGPLSDLRVAADLRSASGSLRLDGRLEITNHGPRYVTRGRMEDLRLDQLVDGVPTTVLTGDFELEGGVGSLHDLDGRVTVDLTGGRIAGVEIASGRLRANLTDGLVSIDTLAVLSPMGRAEAEGSLGLVEGRDGSLRFAVEASTLAPLEIQFFGGTVPDDVALTGPRVDAEAWASGTITGSLTDWRASAEVHGRDLVYDNLALSAAAARLQWSRDGLAVDVAGDSLQAWGRSFHTIQLTTRYDEGAGLAAISAGGQDGHELEMDSRFRWTDGVLDFQLDGLNLVAGDGRWALDQPVESRIGPDGIVMGRLSLSRVPGDASIHISGVLPWRQPGVEQPITAAMVLDLTAIPLGELARLTQSGRDLDGTLGGRMRLTGTALAPVLEGTVYARPFRFDEATLDSLGGRFDYQDRLLTTSLVGWRDGRAIVAADAAVPMELALTHRDHRLLAEPLHVGLRADGMPGGLVSFLIPGLRQVEGIVHGSMKLSGEAAGLAGNGVRPSLEGELQLASGSAYVEPLNARFHDVSGTATMGDGSIVHVDARLRSQNGGAEVTGTLDMAQPADPLFDLRMSARRLDASRRRDVTAVADGDVHLTGRYNRPVLSGDVRLISGEMNLDEVLRQYQIVQLDTSLFHIFDAATIGYRIRPANPFIENLAIRGLSLTADRNFWLRSRELNVEVAGSLDVALDRQFNDIRLTGTMEALRGTYQLQILERVPTRRFEIREGTIEFPGTPGIDPNLQITASHRVRRAHIDPLDVIATVTGTLQSPRVRLSSDSDPPVSETDIASFLLFGRSTLELSQAETDVVFSMREGVLGLARPMFLGLASTQLQQAVANLGLPVDYLALTAPEYGFGDYDRVMDVHGPFGLLQGTQLEAGFYARRDLFVLGSFMPFSRALGAFSDSEPLFHPRWGARLEWRFQPTWTMEMYWEDRFARTPSFSYDQIHDRTVGGLSVYREWGY